MWGKSVRSREPFDSEGFFEDSFEKTWRKAWKTTFYAVLFHLNVFSSSPHSTGGRTSLTGVKERDVCVVFLMCVVACLMRSWGSDFSSASPAVTSREFQRPYPPDVSSTERKENSNGICASLGSGVRSAARRPSRCDRVARFNTTRERWGLRKNHSENKGLKWAINVSRERIYKLCRKK